MPNESPKLRLLTSERAIQFFLNGIRTNRKSFAANGLTKVHEYLCDATGTQSRHFSLGGSRIETTYNPAEDKNSLYVQVSSPAGTTWGRAYNEFIEIVEGVGN